MTVITSPEPGLSGFASYPGDAVRFGVLGPLQVLAGESGQPDAVSAPRLRSLLAVLP